MILEWFESCWAEVIALITSGSFITLIYSLVLSKHNNKKLTENTKATNELKDSATAINNTTKSINTNNDKLVSLERRILQSENTVKSIGKSISAMIDILGLVYVRSKDEDVRNGVSAILNSLKYNSEVTIETLRQEVKALQERLNNSTTEGDAQDVKDDEHIVKETEAPAVETIDSDIVRG